MHVDTDTGYALKNEKPILCIPMQRKRTSVLKVGQTLELKFDSGEHDVEADYMKQAGGTESRVDKKLL